MIVDAGAPASLDGTGLAGSFRYWLGASGRRYLHRVMPLDSAADFPGVPVVLAAVDAAGRREAVWIGVTGAPGFSASLEAARLEGASEAHLHFVGTGRDAAGEVVRDLRATLAAGRWTGGGGIAA